MQQRIIDIRLPGFKPPILIRQRPTCVNKQNAFDMGRV